MNLSRVLRLAGVLLASQLRSGRAGSDPRGFFGRPVAIAVADTAAFSFVFLLSVVGAEAILGSHPSAFPPLLAAVLPFVPLLGVGSVLVGGLMFELASSTKFATSDAVNWLPVTSTEFVLASSLSLTGLYSLAIALLAGIALGIGVAGHVTGVALLAVTLGLGGLFEGALLIEILRAVTQRAGTLGRRRGSATLVVRAAIFLVVILAFQLLFNPVILLEAVRSVAGLGPFGLLIPFLWPSQAVTAALDGDAVRAAVAALGFGVFLGGTAVLAARVRSRFWVPTGGEVEFEAHRFGSPRSGFRSLGLTPSEAALVSKDLRGLVRRRELLPILLVPIVVSVILLVEGARGVNGQATDTTLAIISWVAGLSGLILGASSFGQERRAIAHLFVLPVPSRSVIRAKAAAALLISLPLGAVVSAVGLALVRPPLLTLLGVAVTLVASVGEGVAVGLLFATRYSDFQDRPRPQFIRPIAMLGAMASYSALGALTIGLGFLLTFQGVASVGPLSVVLGLGALIAGCFVAVVAGIGRGARRLLRELPV